MACTDQQLRVLPAVDDTALPASCDLLVLWVWDPKAPSSLLAQFRSIVYRHGTQKDLAFLVLSRESLEKTAAHFRTQQGWATGVRAEAGSFIDEHLPAKCTLAIASVDKSWTGELRWAGHMSSLEKALLDLSPLEDSDDDEAS